MSSSPRFTRGTSVIAALVFAALLGAVALSLNAFNSSSANTAALPAQASGATSDGSSSAQIPTCDAVTSSGNTPVDPTDSTKQACVCLSVTNGKNDYYQLAYQVNIVNGQTVTTRSLAKDQAGSVPETTQCEVTNCSTNAQGTEICPAASQGPSPLTSSTGGSTPTVSADGGLNSLQSCNTAGADPSTCVPAGNYTYPAAPAGGQVINCDATPGLCPDAGTQTPEEEASDPNTYCYNNNTTCYPPDSQLSTWQSDGWTCPTNGDATECYPTSAVQTPGTAIPSPSTCASAPNTAGCSTTVAPPQGPCPPGTTGTAGSCTAAPPATQVPPQTTRPGQTTSASPITSLLSGLARGLTQQPCYSTAQNPYGTSYTMVPQQVVQPNGTIAIVYVQQPTTASPYGTTQPCGAQPLTAAQAPYGVGTNGVACPAPAAPQQCQSGQTPQPISATGNGCVTGYQCVPTSGSTIPTTPTAQLSCSPQVADVGESLTLSYSCANATGSSGSGFSTNNQTSGSATSTVAAPPSGENTATYSLTCNNNGQSASAQCSVQVNTPAIDLVANPSSVQSGSAATIGWVTAGMQSCVISSPQDANFTSENASSNNPNGAVQTDPITQTTEFDLTCQTLGGQTKTASATVTIASSSAATGSEDITMSSTADGQTVNHGSQVTINWNDPTAASGSAIALWLVDINTQEATAVIASQQAASGSYVWNIPNATDSCNPDSYAACASDLVAGRSYGIEATLYTPQNAYLGIPSLAPANAIAPTYTDFGYTQNPFTIGQ